jgi:hypothetical protein
MSSITSGEPAIGLAGSHVIGYDDYSRFRQRLEGESSVFIVQLCASKGVRDRRRAARSKPSNRTARDWVDQHYPEDQELRHHLDEYQYVRIDTSRLSVAKTVALITPRVSRNLRTINERVMSAEPGP